MVRMGDDRAKAQKVVVPAHALFRPAQGLVAEGGVLLHLVEFGFRELAGLTEDAVRHADLADIVQRGTDAEQLDGVVIVVPDIRTHEPGQALGEDFHAVLRTADVRPVSLSRVSTTEARHSTVTERERYSSLVRSLTSELSSSLYFLSAT